MNIPVFTAHPQGAGDELPEVVDHPASADAEIIKIAVEEVARRDHGLDETVPRARRALITVARAFGRPTGRLIAFSTRTGLPCTSAPVSSRTGDKRRPSPPHLKAIPGASIASNLSPCFGPSLVVKI